MKSSKKIAAISLIGIFLLTGVAYAATSFLGEGTVPFDSIRVGQTAVGGVTFFNGTIINETKTSGVENPVTFGDDVRIDGRVWRGATPGAGDTMPFIVRDNVTVEGSLTSAQVEDILTSTYVSATEAATTWTGTIYDICGTSVRSSALTVTFTPASASAMDGTWTSNPVNAFDPNGICDTSIVTPRGTYQGTYATVNDTIFGYSITDPNSGVVATNGVIAGSLYGNSLRYTDMQSAPYVTVELSK